jgi:hypothetical protein
MNSDYKKYSLGELENWIHDAMSSAEASPQEIYDTIKKVVEENYYHHKRGATEANELLALLNGNGKDHTKDWNDFWESSIETDEIHSSEEKYDVNTWIVPIENDWTITFPEDLIEQVGWKVDDFLEWHDQGDGSFKLIKK